MKLFKRRPRRDTVAELRAQMDAAPGVWFPFPPDLALTAEAFLRYEVRGSVEFDSVQIRKKPAARP